MYSFGLMETNFFDRAEKLAYEVKNKKAEIWGVQVIFCVGERER